MSRRSILSLSLAAAILPSAGAGVAPPPPPPDGPARHAFLIVGQSNAVGIARDLPGTDVFPAGTFEFAADGTWSAPGSRLRHPRNPQPARPEPDATHGFARAFAGAYMAARPGTELYMIAAAEGSTSFADGDWRRGDPTYEAAIARANAAMAAAPAGTVLKGILWHQGESDSRSDGQAAAWQAHLHALIGNLRADVLAAGPDTPVVVGGHSRRNGLFRNAVALAAQAVPNAVAHTAYASIDTPAQAGTNPGDSLHYDGPTLNQLGRRMREVLPFAAANTLARGGAPAVGTPQWRHLPGAQSDHVAAGVPLGPESAGRTILVGVFHRGPYGPICTRVEVGDTAAEPVGIVAGANSLALSHFFLARDVAGTTADIALGFNTDTHGKDTAIVVLPVTGVAPWLGSREGWAEDNRSRQGGIGSVAATVEAQAGDLVLAIGAAGAVTGQSSMTWSSPGDAWTSQDFDPPGELQAHVGWTIAQGSGPRAVTGTFDGPRTQPSMRALVLRPGG